jgi:hypothetical protein
MDTIPLDLGSSGVLLLPNLVGSTQHPHLAILGAQTGTLYLLDRDSLGGYTSGGPDNVVQKLALPAAFNGTPAFWQGTAQGSAQNSIYTAASGDTLKAFPVTNAALPVSPSSQSSEVFAYPGASPAVSSNGSNQGIVWALDTSGYGANGATPTPVVVHAYDATNLSTELYNSSLVTGDAAGMAVKFTVPTVANAKVYVGTQGELSVYGLFQ